MARADVDALSAAHFQDNKTQSSLLWFLELWPDSRRRTLDGPRPSDLRWSRDGRYLAVCARELVVLSRVTHAEGAEAFYEGPTGSIGLRRARSTPKSRGPFVASGDFASGARVFSGWSDGSVRRSSATDDDVSTVVAVDEPILRLRCAPATDTLAFATARGVYLWSGGRLTTLGGEASRGTVLSEDDDGRAVAGGTQTLAPGLAWNGARLAVADDRGVSIYENGSITRTGEDSEDSAHAVAWWGETLVSADANTLTLHTPEGGRRKLGPLHSFEPFTTRCTSLTISGHFALAVFFSLSEGHIVLIDLEHGVSAPPEKRPYFSTTTPIELSPTGDALAYVDALARVFPLPWNATHRRASDDVRKFKALLDSGLTDAKWALSQLGEIDATALPQDLQALFSRTKNDLESRMRRQALIDRKDVPGISGGPPRKVSEPADEWTVGTTVKHAKFGEGIVEAVSETGDETKLTIRFAAGTKNLVSKFVTRTE